MWWEDGIAEDLACQLHEANSITFTGVYVHCGNSYKASKTEEIESVREQTIGESISVARYGVSIDLCNAENNSFLDVFNSFLL